MWIKLEADKGREIYLLLSGLVLKRHVEYMIIDREDRMVFGIKPCFRLEMSFLYSGLDSQRRGNRLYMGREICGDTSAGQTQLRYYTVAE